MRLRKLHHAVLRVRDLQRSVPFYTGDLEKVGTILPLDLEGEIRKRGADALSGGES